MQEGTPLHRYLDQLPLNTLRQYKKPSNGAKQITHTTTMRTQIKRNKDKRLGIIIIGDSHARGHAGQLLHHVKQQYKVMGYTKPNAGLTELLHTAKGETSKLTKRDAIIVICGTNDNEKNWQGKHLTSISNFLEGTQHTNSILVDVPLRYDLGDRPHINDEVIKYNRKVNKLAKRYENVKTINAITSRELFTHHGLHLNNKGKEVLIKGIMEKIQNNTVSCKSNAICLPWKHELATVTTHHHIMPTNQTNNRSSESINITGNTKEISRGLDTLDDQSKRTKTLDRQIGKCNCPKLKNKDYLWN